MRQSTYCATVLNSLACTYSHLCTHVITQHVQTQHVQTLVCAHSIVVGNDAMFISRDNNHILFIVHLSMLINWSGDVEFNDLVFQLCV